MNHLVFVLSGLSVGIIWNAIRYFRHRKSVLFGFVFYKMIFLIVVSIALIYFSLVSFYNGFQGGIGRGLTQPWLCLLILTAGIIGILHSYISARDHFSNDK